MTQSGKYKCVEAWPSYKSTVYWSVTQKKKCVKVWPRKENSVLKCDPVWKTQCTEDCSWNKNAVCVCVRVCVCVCVDLFFILHLLCCITVMSQKLQQKRNLNTTTNTNSAISIFTITNHNRHHQPNAIQPNNKTKYYSQTTKQSKGWRWFCICHCRHLRTIALQIEVTQFLEQCLGSRSGEAAAVATQFVAQAKTSTVIPTLFGNQDQRRDVVKMVRSLSGCE